MTVHNDTVRAIEWCDEGVRLLDQRRLPQQHEWVVCRDVAAVADAITEMVVRGAPAIGVTAAYGIALAARQRCAVDAVGWREAIEADLARLAASRPTAVNLFWAIDRMRRAMAGLSGNPFAALLAEARAIHEEDIAANRRMGELGAALIDQPCGFLTHCNTGSLATGGFGTALGVIRAAHAAGKVTAVYADETRPWLQGARLTAWELVQDGIDVTLIADSAAAWLMRSGRVGCVVVGADRIAANGDAANKIGTYMLAVAARRHAIPFYVAAPTSTIDPTLPDGSGIPIEERAADEVLALAGQRVAAPGAAAWNPAFDVTPAELITAIITERGVIEPAQAGATAVPLSACG